ncbi:amidase [Bradyrhizobium sacchari]|uniref:Indoleacetamide hydrolase n=1 Tax=Bradyrhizobium sacchari TaxID=1399419 RepID=A0A560JAH5_9BRAD|nr:amidase [Bradyrhizobium sacchari]OPY94094.1 amidase [Bradyrhizobium sacchari]TWB49361.1 amidase [Bradyrhizobium sacchari]TWB68191.1 amidase [Bradyrhizobium sacchari]
MSLKPTYEEFDQLASELGLSLRADERETFYGMLSSNLEVLNLFDDEPAEIGVSPQYPRSPGHRPDDSEDPHHAWYVKSEIRGAATGLLSGRTVALKDNICLAGVPMMNGSSTLEGYVPDCDATVVTRVLDAGGTILGKANCEFFCFSACSHTNATGPTHNPHRRGYSAGGSSSGCAAAIAGGEADLAIGCDQGGSIRAPASFCGIVGMKPTHGLVPYTGIMPIEPTLDHVGPMTRNVADNALLLQVLQGPDGLDPRQCAGTSDDYLAAPSARVEGMRIALVREGFGLLVSEPDVDAAVLAASDAFSRQGAVVEEVSIPMHATGRTIWRAIAGEGGTNTLMKGNAFGTGWRGLYVTSLLQAHSHWRERADELPPSLKLSMLTGHHLSRKYGGLYYARAQNLNRRLRSAYDEVLCKYDLLLMPTTPMKAGPIPAADTPLSELIRLSGVPLANTMQFNCSGHPALSVPCGESDGLPIGMMLVGRHFQESSIYRAAAAFEACR